MSDTENPEPQPVQFQTRQKWDGYRAPYSRGRLWPRSGTELTRSFPELVALLAAWLPADVVRDGELVAWDTSAGRLNGSARRSGC